MDTEVDDTVKTESYLAQASRWPETGRHILAQCSDNSIIVYQAYRPEIGWYAAEHGWFGGPFSYSRMSWIKPNFLWMMYRSGWGTMPGQQVTLAIELRLPFFEEILEVAVPSSYEASLYETREEWQEAVKEPSVRLQWDPDYDPAGARMERRAVQIGLRGEILKRFGKEEPVSITDISAFVESQRPNANAPYSNLITPKETVYVPESAAARRNLRLDKQSKPAA